MNNRFKLLYKEWFIDFYRLYRHPNLSGVICPIKRFIEYGERFPPYTTCLRLQDQVGKIGHLYLALLKHQFKWGLGKLSPFYLSYIHPTKAHIQREVRNPKQTCQTCRTCQTYSKKASNLLSNLLLKTNAHKTAKLCSFCNTTSLSVKLHKIPNLCCFCWGFYNVEFNLKLNLLNFGDGIK